jgi:hypothetical protein
VLQTLPSLRKSRPRDLLRAEELNAYHNKQSYAECNHSNALMTYALKYNTKDASCKLALDTATTTLMTVYGSMVRSMGSCGRVPGAGAHSSSSGGSGGSRRRTCPS